MEKLKVEPYLQGKATYSHRDIRAIQSERDWEGSPYSPNPDCLICHGAGFLYPCDVQGNPIFRQVVPCHGPNCLKESCNAYKRGEEFVRIKGLQEPKGSHQTFANFQQIGGAKAAYEAARSLANGEGKPFLVIYGPRGCGKTHLCNAIMHKLIQLNIESEMITVPRLFLRLKGANFAGLEKYLNHYKEILTLILDDWGLEPGSEWEKATFEDLIKERFDCARPTVITTNKKFDDFPERLQSRFQDKRYCALVVNSAPDFRLGG